MPIYLSLTRCADALGCLWRVSSPFLLPTTRTIPEMDLSNSITTLRKDYDYSQVQGQVNITFVVNMFVFYLYTHKLQ